MSEVQLDGLWVGDTGQATLSVPRRVRWHARPCTQRLTPSGIWNIRWLDGDGQAVSPRQAEPRGSWRATVIEANATPGLPHLHVSCGIELMPGSVSRPLLLRRTRRRMHT